MQRLTESSPGWLLGRWRHLQPSMLGLAASMTLMMNNGAQALEIISSLQGQIQKLTSELALAQTYGDYPRIKALNLDTSEILYFSQEEVLPIRCPLVVRQTTRAV